MILQWHGHACFKASGSQIDASVVIDPFDASIGLKLPRLSADVVLVTSSDSAHGNWQAVKGAATAPFVIEYPGEYEVRGVFATAVAAIKKNGKDKTLLLSLGLDDVVIGHLGTIDRQLTESELDALGRIDILLLPVGGDAMLNASLAVEVLKEIEPRVVIPMQYKIPGAKIEAAPVDQFLKEYGIKDAERLDKIKLLKRDLPAEETRVIVLNQS
ncbi:MBL fold metallo-hydrolase [Candidatus Uhrbacteria bacterium]|nr:MBL fold metallo-hydrolase [Candidatus Uhrbacteria bacterium]